MPYDPNPNWTARTNAGAKSPVYYIEIDGLTTKHFSTGPVRSPAVTKKALLKIPDAVGQKLSQLQGKATLNLVSLELVDKEGEITDLVATEKAGPTLPHLVNRKVTLKSGYMDLNESDYAVVAVGQINAISLSERNTAYRIDLVDLKRLANDDIFRNAEAGNTYAETRLSANAAVGDRIISVVGGSGFVQGDRIYLGPSSNGGFTGQEEKIEVGHAASASIALRTPLSKAFNSGDEVRSATTLIEGNPINLLYGLLTGDFAHASFPLTKKRGEPTGLGLTAAEVDSAALIAERDDFYADEIWRFEAQRPESGFGFLEKMIYRWLGFPFITIDGKFSLRLYRPERPSLIIAGLPALVKKDILSWSWERAHDLHINRLRLGIDFGIDTQEPQTHLVAEDSVDQTDTREIATIAEERTGFVSDKRGPRLAEERMQALLRRFTKPPDILRVVLPMTKRTLQMGEVLSVTHPDVPNIRTGARGLTNERLEIVEREERFAAEKVILGLQYPNFTRPSFIAPDNAPDYDSASASDKEYAYIAPDVGDFADGGKPYEIV